MLNIDEIKEKYIKGVKHTVCWHPSEVYQPKGGQTVSLSPRGVYLESHDTGFAIFINANRSQITNYDLAMTFFKLYLDETIK